MDNNLSCMKRGSSEIIHPILTTMMAGPMTEEQFEQYKQKIENFYGRKETYKTKVYNIGGGSKING